MIIGVPKEIKKEEFRVGITPSGTEELRRAGHTVLVESDAGSGSGFSDSRYLEADADIVDRNTLFTKADLVVKVKEPLPSEYNLLREGQALFTYLHLAPNRELTGILLTKKITALGYETLRVDNTLPLLSPMSEIAGRMAPLIGSYYLQKFCGGSGILPSGVAGVKPARALILGAGVVGTHAARTAFGIGMDTIVISKGIDRLERIEELFGGIVKTLPSTTHNIRQEIMDADIVIGAVLVSGARTPVLISRDMLGSMRQGSVIVDVSIDQGGIAETSRPATHDDPVYVVDGILHYTVANMPGAFPLTSTYALTNATLPYIRAIADAGIEKVLAENTVIRSSLNTYRGEITNQALAESLRTA